MPTYTSSTRSQSFRYIEQKYEIMSRRNITVLELARNMYGVSLLTRHLSAFLKVQFLLFPFLTQASWYSYMTSERVIG